MFGDGTGGVESGNELLAGLSSEERTRVGSLALHKTLADGASVFVLGQEANSIFVIESGRVSLTVPLKIGQQTQDVTIQDKDAGEVIGWSGLVPPHRFTMNATAAGGVTLLQYERERLEDLFVENQATRAQLYLNLARIVAGRLTQLQTVLMRNMQRWVEDQSKG